MTTATQYPNWFACYADRFFAHHLTPLAGRPGLRFLQVGAFTGDASLWLLEHILTRPGSVLVDVDTWAGSAEVAHEEFDWADVQRTYDERLAAWIAGRRLVKVNGSSQAFFQSCSSADQFDFIYIDGDHTALGVLSDAVQAYPLLKVGGLIGFDDYLWESPLGRRHSPGPAIDTVCDLFDGLEQLPGPELPGQSPLQIWFRRVT